MGEETQSIKTSLEAIETMLPRLDRLIRVMETREQQSSEMISVLRGSINSQLYAGTVRFALQGGLWTYEADFTVPFASVMYVDSQKFGPFTISTDGSGAESGVGTYVSFAGGGDSGRIPLVGRHLSITTANANAVLFLAIFTKTGSSNIN